MDTKTKIIDLSRPVLVSMETFSFIKQEGIVSNDGKLVESALIECDAFSRNPAFYPGVDLRESMLLPRVAERVDNKTFYGEAGHPASDDPEKPISIQRLMRVEDSRVSHAIDKWWFKDNIMYGLVRWCGPFGQDFQDRLVGGSNLAFSLRAYTPNYIKKTDGPNGEYIIKKHPMFITSFDCVHLPGLYKARIIDPDVFKANSLNEPKINLKDYKGALGIEAFTGGVQIEFDCANVINDLSQSNEGLKILSDMYEIDFKNSDITLKPGHRMEVKTAEGLKLSIPTTDYFVGGLFQ